MPITKNIDIPSIGGKMTAPPNFRYIEVKSCYNCAHIEFDYDWESQCGKYKLKRGQDTDFNTVCDDWEAKE
ncbi:MAG: hypothetical protein WC907_06700 [Acholeplasmataceae bacterium]|jgi:hypothetical protein